jgi:acyl-CoA dehydrogenase
MARTDPHAKGAGAISAFVVERGTPGPDDRQARPQDGPAGLTHRGRDPRELPHPAANLIGGKEGVGFKTAMKVLDKGRLHIAAVCVGVAERVLDDALRYAMERKQFGKPIAEFQLVQAMLADSRTEIYAARSMVLDARAAATTARTSRPRRRAASSSRPRWSGRVADRAVQIHGGAGYVSTTRSSASTATCACSASTRARRRSSSSSSRAR